MVPMTDDHPAADSPGSAAPTPSFDQSGSREPEGSGRIQRRRGEGDRRSRLRGTLAMVEGQGVIVLNDRRIPGSKATIAVIAVAPAGVFVIDAQPHKGLVQTKRPGSFDRLGPPELHVGRKNCTPHVEALSAQAAVVRSTLDGSLVGSHVPVTAMLCLTRAEWGLASSALVRDVWVGWPRLLAGTLRSPGAMDAPQVNEVAQMIEIGLPAA
jgi:hypothetical protein